jgi:hypothetical protein
MPKIQITDTLSAEQLESLRLALLQKLQGSSKELPIVKYEIQLDKSFQGTLNELNRCIDRLESQTSGNIDFVKKIDNTKNQLTTFVKTLENEWKTFDKSIEDSHVQHLEWLQNNIEITKSRWVKLESDFESVNFDQKIKQLHEDIKDTRKGIAELASPADELNDESLKPLRKEMQNLSSQENFKAGTVSKFLKSGQFNLVLIVLTLGLSAFTAWKLSSDKASTVAAVPAPASQKPTPASSASTASDSNTDNTKTAVVGGSAAAAAGSSAKTDIIPSAAFCSATNATFCTVLKKYQRNMCLAIDPIKNPNDTKACQDGIALLLRAT